MPNPHNLTIGQKLWYVPGERRGEPREVTIVTVGRKWFSVAEISWARFDNERLKLDSEYGGGVYCYLSREVYEAQVGLSVAWREFQRAVERARSTDPQITIENIAAARKLLGMGGQS